MPNKFETTKFEAIAPAKAFIQTNGEKLWNTSSKTNKAPLKGAPKAADKPLEAPVASRILVFNLFCLHP
ncbi:Uncharacterised protein [Chlamydia trachomatis]|nr:Uncharacterised protein [Chlamydia trachomatis]